MAAFFDAFGGGAAEGGDSPQLSEAERREFDETTYDKIQLMTDVKKLARLEAYMRSEEFFTTADVAQARLRSLRGSAGDTSASVPPARKNSNAELDKVLAELNSWEASVKGADKALKTDAATAEEEAPPVRRQVKGKISKAEPISEPKPKNAKKLEQTGERTKDSKDVRSGADYYKKWDKVADDLEKGPQASPRESKPTPPEAKPAAQSAPEEVPGPTLSAEAADRLVDAAWKKPTVEREWLANREREKGNELFKSQEYQSSLAAYSLAIRLMPTSAAAFANRAATHLQLKHYRDAETDCTKALEIDPAYLKALRRRATARLELGEPAAALADLEVAQKLDPEDAEVAELLQKARAKVVPKNGGKQKPLKRMQIEEVDGEDTGSTPETEKKEAGRGDKGGVEKTGTASGLKAGDGGVQENGNGNGNGIGNGTRDGSGNGSGREAGKKDGIRNGNGNGNGNGSGNRDDFRDGDIGESSAGADRQAGATGGSVSDNETDSSDQTGTSTAGNETKPEDEAEEKEGVSKPEGPTKEQKLADEWREKGNVLYKRGDTTGAEACYTHSLTYSKNAAALSNRAMCRNKVGRFREAEEDASAAIAADSTYVKAYHRRAAARRAMGKKEEAMEDYKVVSRAMPGNAGLQEEIRSLEGEMEESMYIPPRKGAFVVEEVEEGKPSPKGHRPSQPAQAPTTATAKPAPKATNPPANRESTPRQPAKASEGPVAGKVREETRPAAEGQRAAGPRSEASKGDSKSDVPSTSKVEIGPGSAETKPGATGKVEPDPVLVLEASEAADSGSASTSKGSKVEETGSESNGTGPKRNPNGTEPGRNETEPTGNGTDAEPNGAETEQAEWEKEEGNRLFKLKDLPGAIEHYSRAIDLQPGNAAYYGNRAMCHLQLKAYEKVVGDTTRAIELDPGYTKAYYRRALGRKGLGQYELALVDLKFVQKRLPRDKQVTEEVLAVTDLYMRRFEKLTSPSSVTAAGAFSSPINLPPLPKLVDPNNPEPSPKKFRETTPPAVKTSAEPSVPAKTVLPPWLKEQLTEQFKQGGLKPQETTPSEADTDVPAGGMVRQVGSLTDEVFKNKPPRFESNQGTSAFSVGSFDKKMVSPSKTSPRSPATRKKASARVVTVTATDAEKPPNERNEESGSAAPEAVGNGAASTRTADAGGTKTAHIEPPIVVGTGSKGGVDRAADGRGGNIKTASGISDAKAAKRDRGPTGKGAVETRAVETEALHNKGIAASTTEAGHKDPEPDAKPLPPRPRSALDFERACARLETPERVAAYLKTVEPASYPSIIKENLSAVLMTHIVNALPALPLRTRGDVMSALADVSRFKLVWMLLPAATRKLYAAAYKELQQEDSEVAPDVQQKLLSLYKF